MTKTYLVTELHFNSNLCKVCTNSMTQVMCRVHLAALSSLRSCENSFTQQRGRDFLLMLRDFPNTHLPGLPAPLSHSTWHCSPGGRMVFSLLSWPRSMQSCKQTRPLLERERTFVLLRALPGKDRKDMCPNSF